MGGTRGAMVMGAMAGEEAGAMVDLGLMARATAARLHPATATLPLPGGCTTVGQQEATASHIPGTGATAISLGLPLAAGVALGRHMAAKRQH